MRAALYFVLSVAINALGTFFNVTHQVKAITIRTIEDNPLAKLIDCCDVYIYKYSSLQSCKIDTKSYPQIPIYGSLLFILREVWNHF